MNEIPSLSEPQSLGLKHRIMASSIFSSLETASVTLPCKGGFVDTIVKDLKMQSLSQVRQELHNHRDLIKGR